MPLLCVCKKRGMGGRFCKAREPEKVYAHDIKRASITRFFDGRITLAVVNLILEYEAEFLGERLHTFELPGADATIHPVANGAFLCRRGRHVLHVDADRVDFLPFEGPQEIATMAASDTMLAFSTHAWPEILLWNLAANEPMGTLVGHTTIPTQMVWLSNSQLLSTSGLSLRVWDLATRDQMIIYAAANALAALPHGQFASAHNGITTVWGQDGQRRHRFVRNEPLFKQTLVALNDSLLASVGTHTVLPNHVDLYNFVNGKCLMRIAFPVVKAVCLSCSGMLVVAHGEFAKPTFIELFDVERLRWHKKVEIGGFLGNMARLSNGRLVVSNCDAACSTVEVWR